MTYSYQLDFRHGEVGPRTVVCALGDMIDSSFGPRQNERAMIRLSKSEAKLASNERELRTVPSVSR